MLSSSLGVDVINKVRVFAGQHKFVDKSSIPEGDYHDFIEMLEKSERITLSFSEANPLNALQTIIVALFVMGVADTEVASILNVSRNTVKAYSERIKVKLGATTKLQSIIEALRIGIIKFV